MFRFNFNTPQGTLDEPEDDIIKPVQEVIPSDQGLQKFSNVECENFNVGDIKIKCLKGSDILKFVALDKEDDSIIQAETNHSDLTSGSYEGGLKIWECTFDLAEHLIQNDIKCKNVLDLGCGSGLLGIVAHNLGAENVHFQDYNIGVVKNFTIPNVYYNNPEFLDKSKFWSGDWKAFGEIDCLYDLILSSETIYNSKNHEKLHNLFTKKLKQDGTILLAAKSYYFGVGGSIKQFQDLIDEKEIFQHQTVWSANIGVKREIMKITFK